MCQPCGPTEDEGLKLKDTESEEKIKRNFESDGIGNYWGWSFVE